MDLKLRSALEKLEAARELVNEAVSALSTVDEFAHQRSELRRLHDSIRGSCMRSRPAYRLGGKAIRWRPKRRALESLPLTHRLFI